MHRKISTFSLIALFTGSVIMTSVLLAEEQAQATMIMTLAVGDVKYRKSEDDKWRKVPAKLELKEEYQVRTGQDSKARIRFLKDNTEFLIPAEKTVKMADLVRKKDTLLGDKQMMLLNKLKLRMQKDDSASEHTPTAVAGVRGNDVSKEDSGSTNEVNELIWDEE